MIIAIPTEKNIGMESPVYGHFGSAPFFALYNLADDTLSFLNNAEKEHEHGQCQPTGELKEKNVEAVVCGGMGMRAIRNLNQLGIKVYFSENAASIKGLIEKWKRDEIREIQAQDACGGHENGHHEGGGHHGEGHGCH